MTSLTRSLGGSGALFDLAGFVANNATWEEDIYFTEDGAALDISELDWKLTLRRTETDTSAALTLSTDDGTLSIEDDEHGDPRILRISVPAGTLSSYEGDYIADLASRDSNGKVMLWAHGLITFRPNPISWS